MISKEIRKKIINELAKDGNILNTCRKVGVSPATFYRWRKGDPKFRKQSKDAENIGRQNMASVADHALMLKVKDKDLGAIKWFQVHNDPRYKPKRRKVYIEHSNSYKDEIARQTREEWEKASQERKRIAEALEKVLDDDDIIEVSS